MVLFPDQFSSKYMSRSCIERKARLSDLVMVWKTRISFSRVALSKTIGVRRICVLMIRLRFNIGHRLSGYIGEGRMNVLMWCLFVWLRPSVYITHCS